MTIRFGIVGPGKVAQLHADALARIPGARPGRGRRAGTRTRAAALAAPHERGSTPASRP